MVKIGIITGSVRRNRVNLDVCRWLYESMNGKVSDTVFEIIDIKDFNLPIFDGSVPPLALNRKYEFPEAVAFSKKLDEMDGYIFVTPEYNRNYPGALKNAMDHVAPEFSEKAAAVVSYGGNGGMTAQMSLRNLLTIMDLYVISKNLSFNIYTEFTEGKFTPREEKEDNAIAMAITLSERAHLLKSMRK